MSIVLDIIIAGIIVLVTVISARRGFVRTVIECVGFVAAILIAVNAGAPIAGMVYDKTVKTTITELSENITGDSAQEIIDEAWAALPDFVVENSERFGITKEVVNQKLDEYKTDDIKHTVANTVNAVVSPVFVKIAGMLIAFILFLILTIIVHIAANLINKMFSFSLVGSINKLLGGAVGIVKGAVFALVFCVITGFIISVTGGFSVFTPEAIEGSRVFKFLLSLTPFSF